MATWLVHIKDRMQWSCGRLTGNTGRSGPMTCTTKMGAVAYGWFTASMGCWGPYGQPQGTVAPRHVLTYYGMQWPHGMSAPIVGHRGPMSGPHLILGAVAR